MNSLSKQLFLHPIEVGNKKSDLPYFLTISQIGNDELNAYANIGGFLAVIKSNDIFSINEKNSKILVEQAKSYRFSAQEAIDLLSFAKNDQLKGYNYFPDIYNIICQKCACGELELSVRDISLYALQMQLTGLFLNLHVTLSGRYSHSAIALVRGSVKQINYDAHVVYDICTKQTIYSENVRLYGLVTEKLVRRLIRKGIENSLPNEEPLLHFLH